MTVEQLRSYNVKQLAKMAKEKGVQGWHSMRKEQLVNALAPPSKKQSRSSSKSTKNRVDESLTSSKSKAKSSAKAKPPRKEAELDKIKDKIDRTRNLAYKSNASEEPTQRDRLVVMVRDPYWLHAYWELTRNGIQRAEAALAQEWHTAKPVLRLFEVPNQGVVTGAESLVRTIPIHGGTNNWYIDVKDPPKSYRMDIGYLARNNKFFVVARSNIVSTPRAGAAMDENWTDVAEHCEKIYAMSGGYSTETPHSDLKDLFEERLRRPMVRNSTLNAVGQQKQDFHFSLDAEMIITGATTPDARVTLQGDPVQLRSDGTFTVRFSMPDSRQIIPAVASSADGSEQRTIVVAIERNTKVMEPVVRDLDE